jgi:hypothetical protein
MPGELFDLLSSDNTHWQLVESASLAGTDTEKSLTDAIRRTVADPLPALTNRVADYKATMVTMILGGKARILQIEKVQLLNRLFQELNKIREQIVSATAQLPANDVATLVDHVQSEISPLLDRVVAAVGTNAAPKNDLLFMNHRALVAIVLAPKGSGTITLANHWMATLGGATLHAPDEDFVDRYIVSQKAIVATIELRGMGALPPSPDARWELPPDLPAALAIIQGDIQRLDACRLSDWHVQRADLRKLLVRMQQILMAATP